jgi:hypothetical protein
MYIAVYAYIAGVILVGIGAGIYFQFKLTESQQDVRLPSAYTVRA